MTNEEAIKILKSKMDGSVDTSYEWAEAVRMAIETLKAKTEGDLISRRDAIDALGEEPPVWWYDGEVEIAERNQWRRDKAAIESLPSADAVSRDDLIKAYEKGLQAQVVDLTESRPTGEWKQISPARIYECSECGQNVMTDDIEEYNFCHGCGARMVREDGEV